MAKQIEEIEKITLPDGRIAKFSIPPGYTKQQAMEEINRKLSVLVDDSSEQIEEIEKITLPDGRTAKFSILPGYTRQQAMEEINRKLSALVDHPSSAAKPQAQISPFLQKLERTFEQRPATTALGVAGGMLGGAGAIPIGGLPALVTGPLLAGVGTATGGAIDRAVLDYIRSKRYPDMDQSIDLKGALVPAAKDFSVGAATDALSGGLMRIPGFGAKVTGSVYKSLFPFGLRAGIGDLAESATRFIPPTSRLKYQIAAKGIGQFLNKSYAAAKEAFEKSEAARMAAHKEGLAELEGQFISQEARKKAAAQAAKEAFEKNKLLARESVENLPETLGLSGRVSAGAEIIDAADQAQLKLSQQFSQMVNPVLNKYGNKRVSVEPTRKYIFGVMQEAGLTTQNGGIDREAIKAITSPKLREFYTISANILDKLRRNPTLKGLKTEEASLSSLANFKSANRTKEDKMFAMMWNAAKENYLEAIEAASGNADDALKVAEAKSIYSKKKPMIEFFQGMSNKSSEQIIDGARRNIAGSTINDVVQNNPELVDPLKSVVINDLARSSRSPEAFKQAVNHYTPLSLQRLFGKDYAVIDAALKRFSRSAVKPDLSRYGKAIKPSPIPFKPGEFQYTSASQKWIEKFNKGEMPKTWMALRFIDNASKVGARTVGQRIGLQLVRDETTNEE